MNHATNTKTNQLQQQLKALQNPSKCGLLCGSIDYVQGHARFIDPYTIALGGVLGNGERIKSDYFVIATGSRPRVISKYDVDGVHVLTSDHIHTLREFPRSLLVVGSGVIGCEFATIFANFGKTKVYLLNEKKKRILPYEDEDLSTFLQEKFVSTGINVRNNVELLGIERIPSLSAARGIPGLRASYRYLEGSRLAGKEEHIEVEKVLLAVGRIPNTDDLNLDVPGVELNDRNQVSLVNCWR